VSAAGPPVRPGNYAQQARTYDYTRGASPTVVRTVAKYLGTPGGLLLDIAGGTGNYAQVFLARGFRVVVVDASVDMLRRSVPKVGSGRQVAADAMELPFRDQAFDCAMLVHGLHLIPDPSRALGEVRRLVRAGPAIVMDPTSDNVPLFVHEYFGIKPSAASRPSTAQLVAMLQAAGFGRVDHEPVIYTDSVDGSLHALHTSALHLAGPAYLRNTSFWTGLDDDTRRAGLAALARDLRSGLLEERVRAHFEQAAVQGHETAFAAWP
jgi:SAM-dependent methyltransferase